MGKYMKKAKLAGDVAVMDVSQASLGVRTRAKTLALQRLQSSSTAPPVNPPAPLDSDSCYLELRSRRLQKPPLLRQQFLNSRKNTPLKTNGCLCLDDKENPQIEKVCPGSGVNSDSSIGQSKELDHGIEMGDSEIEASFGENNLDSEPRERSTRESTPCSLIRGADTIPTPGSSTKQRSPAVTSIRAQNAGPRSIPSAQQIEEFFAREEQLVQRRFVEKYNFDIVNDVPLPGRYEWVRVMP